MKYFLFKVINYTKSAPLALLLIAAMLAGSYGALKLLFILFPVKELNPDSRWIETVGTMSKYALGRSGKGYMEYKVYNNNYKEINNISRYGRVLGEKYKILVNPKDHHEYLMKTWEPIFVEGENISYCFGKITRTYTFDWGETDSFNTNHGIEFSYRIMGDKYEREQDLPPEYTGIYKRLKKGDTFKVEYLVENPQRSIMIFH